MSYGDDYSYPNDEKVNAYREGSRNTTETITSLFKNKRFVITSLVSILFYVAVGMFASSHLKKNAQGEKSQTVIDEPAPIEPTKPEIVAPQPSINDNSYEMMTAAVNNVSSDKVDKIEKSIGNLQDSISTMSNQLTRVERDTNDSLEQTRRLDAKLDRKLAELKAKPKVVKPKPKLREYKITAIIDGRAWLEGLNLESRSVTVGDKIKSYGVVLRMDPVKGEVYTSSARVIYLGDDSR